MESNAITASMEKIIVENIQQQDLKELLIEFVQNGSRKHKPFGELCVFHYEHYATSFDKEIVEVAAAIELLVLSFDILDDLEDKDTENKPWMHNPVLSLNGSTALLFLAMQAIRKTHFTYKDKAIAIIERLALRAISGQHKDLLNVCMEENDYIQMIEEKSGSLVSLACLVGCVIANGDAPKEVKNYSKWLGVIGQINNDVSDLKEWNDKNDILHKKYSLPIIYLLDVEKHSEHIVTKYYQSEMSKAEFLKYKHVIQRKLVDTDALKYALVIKTLFQKKVQDQFTKMDFSNDQLEFLQNFMK
ncbi:polyprenyl synthetase family protein [Psychrobacillus soli]|uniref:Transcriptional regulator n=1 Tax=Psychrobacillus soli TaxID=1543965 RepID=A0A544TFT1_9BACI|nr:polyprenyl synthetase family protein [Psychrobacillus soli]TQR16314.1 transcriptional regulator [Psychrobacillus soli]